MTVDTRQRRTVAIQMIAVSWCNLRAWQPVDMRSVHVAVKFRKGWASTGSALVSKTHGQVDIIVRLGVDEADGLATLLHELAHVAAQRRGHEGHDGGWRDIFRAAALEVLGEEVVDGGSNLVLTDRVADAFRRKWRLQLAPGRVSRQTETDADARR